jgi:hypothetical protein
MATERLQIILEAIVKGQAAIKELQRDLGGLDKAADGAKKGAKALGAQLGITAIGFGTVVLGAKAAWAAFEGGAALEKSRDQFDRLTVSINSTGDAMLGKLRAATNGMVSDADLVAQAGQIMKLGLQDTEEGVVRLTAVAGKLGWDMSQVILTMANDSVMRLDALGLSVEAVNEKMRDFMSQGFAKGEAFDMAVIAAGEDAILKVGDAAFTTSGKIDALKTVYTNTNDAFKTSFASELATQFFEAADGALALNNALVTAATEGGVMAAQIILETIGDLQALAIMAQDIANGNFGAAANFDFGAMAKALIGPGFTSFSEFVKKPVTVSPLQGEFLGSLGAGQSGAGPGLPAAGIMPVQAIDESTAALKNNTAAGRLADKQRQEGAAIMADYNKRGLETAHAIEAQEAALKGGGRGGGGLVGALQESVEAMSQLSAASGDLFSRLRGAKEFNLAEELFGMGDKMGWGATDMASFGVTAGLFDQGRANELMNQSYLLQAAEQMMASGMKGEELWGAIQALQGQLAEGGGLAAELFATIDETSAEAQLLLDTSVGYGELDAFVLAVEEANPMMNIGVNFPGDTGGSTYNGEPYSGGGGIPGVPSTGGPVNQQPQGAGNVTINAYNERTAALAMTMLAQMRRNGGTA